MSYGSVKHSKIMVQLFICMGNVYSCMLEFYRLSQKTNLPKSVKRFIVSLSFQFELFTRFVFIKSFNHSIFAYFRLAVLKLTIFRKTRNSNCCFDIKRPWSAENFMTSLRSPLTDFCSQLVVLSRNSKTFVSAL